MTAATKIGKGIGVLLFTAAVAYGLSLANETWAKRSPQGGVARWAALQKFGPPKLEGASGAIAKWALKAAASSDPNGLAAKAAVAALDTMAMAGNEAAVTAVCLQPIALHSAPRSVEAAIVECSQLAESVPLAQERVAILKDAWQFKLARILEGLS